MNRILFHIIGFTQLIVSVSLVVKWLSKPTNIGPLGADNIIFDILLTFIVTVVSLVLYLTVETSNIGKLIPAIIAFMTVLTIMIGVPVKEKIEENKKPIIMVDMDRFSIKLFEDNDYEIMNRSAEYAHFDRGIYQRADNKIILDKKIYIGGCFTNFFFVNNTTLYVINNSSLDTISYEIKR